MLNSLVCNGPRESGVLCGPSNTVSWVPTVTYAEPPVPTNTCSSALQGTKRAQKKSRDISQGVNLLDVLCCIFEAMGDRCDSVDQSLHNAATVPPASAIQKYRKHVQVVSARDRLLAVQCASFLQVLTDDAAIQEEAL